jgi:hypothetical protein
MNPILSIEEFNYHFATKRYLITHMRWFVFSLMFLSGCAMDQYLDPEYANKRFEMAVAGVEANKPLACVSSDGVFWVRGGDWEEIVVGNEDGPDWIVVRDSQGNEHTIWSDVANPNCTVKD